jgi:hypothetical protein
MSSTDPLDIYLLTFNCARLPVRPTDFAPSLFSALPDTTILPDIFALSIQEVAPIAHSFLGGVLVDPYFNAIARTVSLAATQRLQDHATDVEDGDPGLVHVLTRHVGLTALMVFARPTIKENISWIKTAGTGCGLWSMGNKGAVGARFGIATGAEDALEVTFVAAHLAPHEQNIKRRNHDFETIVRNLVFSSDTASSKGSKAVEADEVPLLSSSTDTLLSGLYDTPGLIIFAGDLNYRTSASRPTEQDPKTYPQPHHPEQSTFHHLTYLSRDQLSQEKAANRTLQHFQEAKITFAPTYKYSHDPKSESIETSEPGDPNGTWNWSAHRWPSWCDRILYLPATPEIQVRKYDSLPLQVTSDHRPVALSLKIQTPRLQVAGYESPYPLNPSFAEERASAKRLELAVGCLAYLGLTKEGNTIVAGIAIGAMLSTYIVHSLM